jgi:hypothetical protein
MEPITINFQAFNLTPANRAAGDEKTDTLETKLIIVRPDINLAKIPNRGMNLTFQAKYDVGKDLPPSIVKLPFGMRERRTRNYSPHGADELTPPQEGITTVTITVRVETYARSGDLVVMTGPSGSGDWMEKTSSGWIEVMP